MADLAIRADGARSVSARLPEDRTLTWLAWTPKPCFRLSSVLSVCEHEGSALDQLRDPRLAGVLQAMTTLRAEIVAALASLKPLRENGRET
jgi:hypothetical protein